MVNQILYPKDFIEKLKPNTNYVLVKIDDPNEYRVTEHGIFLYIDVNIPTANHANRFGTVISVCDRLRFGTGTRKETSHGQELNVAAVDSLENDTDLEVKVGDTVWFSYLNGLGCTEFVTEEFEEDKYGRKFRISYKLLRYDALRLRLRDGQYRTLNGNIIIEPDEEEVKSELIVERVKSTTTGTVKITGTPNRSYKTPTYSDGEGVKVGDKVVVMLKSNMIRLFEYPIHGKLNKNYQIVRGCDVFGVIEQSTN